MEYTEKKNVAFTGVETKPELHDGKHIAQGLFVDGLPGPIFAGVTLFWVVTSFAGLMWSDVPATTMLYIQRFAHALFGS